MFPRGSARVAFRLLALGVPFAAFACSAKASDGSPSSAGTASSAAGASGSGMASGGQSSNGGTNSGGTKNSGGSANTGGGANTGGQGGAPAHTVAACDSLRKTGAWEQITPAAVSLDPSFNTPAGTNFGVHSFLMDPTNTATLYLGTSAQGIYKTTDCGGSWVHIDTGRNAGQLDKGRQWTFVIDPVDPKVLYTNSGYGTNNAWKSTNGGVDWDPLIDEQNVKALQFGGFVHLINMDPTDPHHLIVTPHFACEIGAVNGLPKTQNCLLETKDAGATWTIREGTPGGFEGAGEWMDDSNNWYWERSYEGLWHTGNGGATWEHVYSGGYAGIRDFRLPGGKYLLGGVFSVLQSSDGSSWSSIPNSPGADIVTGDDRIIYIVRGPDYYSAPASDTTKWMKLPTPAFPRPSYIVTWDFRYDRDHHVLYSVNSTNGFWRYVTE